MTLGHRGGPAPYNDRMDDWLAWLRTEARTLGFSGLGVADINLADVENGLQQWLEAGYHGTMEYMARHGLMRARPAELVPGSVRAVMVTIDYTPNDPDWLSQAWSSLQDGERAFVSRYALGRDYHKVVRHRLSQLAHRLQERIGPYGWRAFCDSAPVMEVELAVRAGLGWRGKHTLLLSREGSMRFIGTLLTDLPLPVDEPTPAHCGQCRACLDACPTGAIVAPYRLDARRCISYLTIELAGDIPLQWRSAIGNRIYGCDDCQLACPWNKFAQPTSVSDFAPRHALDQAGLIELFSWDEARFLAAFEGSAIRRIGHARWLRNIAVALGNAPTSSEVVQALRLRVADPDAMVARHVRWALEQHESRLHGPGGSSADRADQADP
jgi:epoxyqueuosine reductase